MKPLPIVWQRLVNTEGRTCPRCHGTGDEMLGALDRLRAALAPLGVEPQLETVELNEAVFLTRPSESNRIWIAGKPLEECGDKDCRTVEVAGQTYEVIPEELIVRAGVIAASQMLNPKLGA